MSSMRILESCFQPCTNDVAKVHALSEFVNPIISCILFTIGFGDNASITNYIVENKHSVNEHPLFQPIFQ